MSSKFHDIAEQRSRHSGQARSEAAAAATKLMPGAGLLAALLFSLGLWARIWQAVSALAPPRFGKATHLGVWA